MSSEEHDPCLSHMVRSDDTKVLREEETSTDVGMEMAIKFITYDD